MVSLRSVLAGCLYWLYKLPCWIDRLNIRCRMHPALRYCFSAHWALRLQPRALELCPSYLPIPFVYREKIFRSLLTQMNTICSAFRFLHHYISCFSRKQTASTVVFLPFWPLFTSENGRISSDPLPRKAEKTDHLSFEQMIGL